MRLSTTIVCLLAFFAKALSDKSCEEELTSDIKMKIVRDSLKQVKIFFPTCRDADEDSAKCGKSSNALAHMNLAIDTLEGLTLVGNKNKVCPICPDPIVKGGGGPIDCEDILKMGHKESGVYTIYPRDSPTKSIKVFCDMDTDGGGWTVFQRRGNFSTQTNFHQEWDTYKKGFGDIEKDFWLGNENIHTLSNQAVYSLRIDAKNVDREYRYSHLNVFLISNETSGYTLYVYDFTGNISGNDLETQHRRKFSTKDRPHEGMRGTDVCANMMHGGWWYPPINTCGHMNLNGLYMPGIDNLNSNWHYRWTGYRGLLFSEMKIRRQSFHSEQ